MIEERATITAIQGNEIEVTTAVKSGCSHCHQVDTCANGQVAKALPQKSLKIILVTEVNVNQGDDVIIGIPETSLLRSAWQVYMWPLFGLLLFAFIAQQLLQQGLLDYEWQVILTGVVGAVTGGHLVKWWQKTTGLEKELMPTLIKVIPQELVTTELK